MQRPVKIKFPGTTKRVDKYLVEAAAMGNEREVIRALANGANLLSARDARGRDACFYASKNRGTGLAHMLRGIKSHLEYLSRNAI